MSKTPSINCAARDPHSEVRKFASWILSHLLTESSFSNYDLMGESSFQLRTVRSDWV